MGPVLVQLRLKTKGDRPLPGQDPRFGNDLPWELRLTVSAWILILDRLPHSILLYHFITVLFVYLCLIGNSLLITFKFWLLDEDQEAESEGEWVIKSWYLKQNTLVFAWSRPAVRSHNDPPGRDFWINIYSDDRMKLWERQEKKSVTLALDAELFLH